MSSRVSVSLPSLVSISHINQHCNPIEGPKDSNTRPRLLEFSGAAAKTSIQVLNSRDLLSPSPGDEKSKTKVSAADSCENYLFPCLSHSDSGNNL